MALIKCKECGNKVSTTAKTCPKCGAEITADEIREAPKKTSARKMTLIIFIGFAGVIAFLSVQTGIEDRRGNEKAAAEQARLAALRFFKRNLR